MNIENRISLAVTVRASEAVIIKFIEYHLSRGLMRFICF